MAERPPPRFTGVRTFKDPLGRYSFRHPTDWHQFDLVDQDGVMFAPHAADPLTAITVWVTPLEETVVAEDLDDLRLGVGEGLAKFAECRVEAASEVVLGNLIKFERVFAFRENSVTRKRKLWLLYVDKWLMSLTWQGSNEAEYDYWLAMANYAFATFTLPEALWFATDRDLSRHDR